MTRPRGKITTSATADWHLFMGDESALPAIFAMTEALPPDRPAMLVLEIPQQSDEQDLDAAATIRISWLHRLGAPAGDSSALAAEAAEIELPPGRGHAYLFGEATSGCARAARSGTFITYLGGAARVRVARLDRPVRSSRLPSRRLVQTMPRR